MTTDMEDESSVIRDVASRVELSRSTVEVGVYVVWLAYLLLMLYDATGYTESARLFPLVVGGALVVLTLLRIGVIVTGVQLLQTEELFDVDQGPDGGETETEPVRSLVLVAWMVTLVTIVYFVGLYAGIATFVFVFTWRYEGSLKVAVVSTVLTLLVMHFLFTELLGAKTWAGALLE